MGLIDRLRQWFKQVPRYGEYSAPAVDLYGRQKRPSDSDLVTAWKETVYACSNLNAGGVASTPLRLYVTTGRGQPRPKCATRPLGRKSVAWLRGNAATAPLLRKAESVEEVVEHPLLTLLEEVNELLDGYSLMELTDLYQEITGKAYWWLPGGPLGVPEAIWVLPTQHVRPNWSSDHKTVLSYDYGSGPNAMRIAAEEVIRFTFPSLADPYGDGWSPARAAWESILMQNKAAAFVNAMFDNRGRPDAILSLGDQVGEFEAERAEKRFAKKFRAGGAGGIMVAPGKVDLKQLVWTPKELDALPIGAATKISIANAYGVPMSLLETKDINRANAEAGHYQHARCALRPRTVRLGQRLSQTLCPRFDDRLFLAFDDPVPDDEIVRTQIRTANLQARVTTVNEERAELGMEPVAWGDAPFVAATDYQYGEERPVPQPFGLAAEPADTWSVLADHATGRLSTAEAVAKLCEGGYPQARARTAVELPSLPAPRCCHHEKDARGQPPLPAGTKLAEALRRWFGKQKRFVFDRIGAKAIHKDILDLGSIVSLDLGEFSALMAADMQPLLEQAYDAGALRALARIGVSADTWDVSNPKVQQAVERASMTFCETTNRTTSLQLNDAIERLRAEIADGTLQGEPIPELAKRVNAVFDYADRHRATVIAQTESSRAVHTAERMAAEETGLVEGYDWLLATDACPECIEFAKSHGTTDLSAPFAVLPGGGPYAEIMGPPLHPNCRCTMTERLKSDLGGKP